MRSVLFAVSLAIVAPACGPTTSDDPVREKFITACKTHRSTSSMSIEEGIAHCRCVYDKTMSRLSSNTDKQVARFYLLSQIGADTDGLVDKSSVVTMADGMARASQAIGRAAKQCRR